MFRFETFRSRANRRPSLSLVLAACAAAVLVWVPILAISREPIWFW